MRVKIYVEGGGDTNALKRECRRGFSEFFRRSGLEGRMPKVVASGSRNSAFKDFCTALRSADSGQFIMLLVDSEDGLDAGAGLWEHVSKRDKWTRPELAGEDSLHLMVQCMESWIVADKDCLRAYYGQDFKPQRLPQRPEVERIAKADLYASLAGATQDCGKGAYSKGQHSFDILAMLDTEKVAAASPYARRLLETLRAKL